MLLVYGIYGFYLMSEWISGPPALLVFPILLLASGVSLVAFSFRLRRWDDGEVGA